MAIKSGRFKGFRKSQGNAVGRKAIRVYECDNCGNYSQIAKFESCNECGGESVNSFDSNGEFIRWRELKLIEKAGLIKDLRRQVRMPLYAYNGDIRTRVSYLVIDYQYREIETGELICEDFKGTITDVAILKIKWLEAQGYKVKLTKG